MVISTAANGAKRKASTAGLTATGRTAKRRASKACHCCRSRKVRCDVVESGIPCTNCRLDEVECMVTEGKRRRKSFTELDLFNPSPVASIEGEDNIPSFPMFDDIDGLNDLSSLSSVPEAFDVLNHELNHHKPHLLCRFNLHSCW